MKTEFSGPRRRGRVGFSSFVAKKGTVVIDSVLLSLSPISKRYANCESTLTEKKGWRTRKRKQERRRGKKVIADKKVSSLSFSSFLKDRRVRKQKKKKILLLVPFLKSPSWCGYCPPSFRVRKKKDNSY